MATATADKNVEAKPRQSGTKNDARRVRKSGMVHLFDPAQDSSGFP